MSETGPQTASPFPAGGFTVPNLLTGLRLLLAAPIGYFIWQRDYDAAFALALVSALTDGLDGYIARRYSLQSKLGTFLDPAADKVTALSAFYLLSLNGDLPLWLLALAVARDASLFGGFFVLYLKQAQRQPIPLAAGRLATLSQFLLLFGILFPEPLKERLLALAGLGERAAELREGLVWFCAASLALSFIAYGRAALRREHGVADRRN